MKEKATQPSKRNYWQKPPQYLYFDKFEFSPYFEAAKISLAVGDTLNETSTPGDPVGALPLASGLVATDLL